LSRVELLFENAREDNIFNFYWRQKAMRKTVKATRHFIMGTICGVLIAAMATTAFAATGSKMLEVFYNNIMIYIDGSLITPKDANGNIVEPFAANGTTYLPVRAVGEAFGKTVEWDGATQSVYIGKRPDVDAFLLDVVQPYEKSSFTYVAYVGGDTMQMGGTKYRNGFTLCQNPGYVLFNLNSQYSVLTGVIGPVDGSGTRSGFKVNFFGDGKLIKSIELGDGDLPIDFSVDLSGVMQFKVERTGDWSHDTGLAELKIK
jgi:hypothetical protein